MRDVKTNPLVLLAYMAHPVGHGAVAVANVQKAKARLYWLIENLSAVAFADEATTVTVLITWVAPWLPEAELSFNFGRESAPHEEIMLRCETTAGQCDLLFAFGDRVSPGMEREARACREGGGRCFNMTGERDEMLGHLIARLIKDYVLTRRALAAEGPIVSVAITDKDGP
jgi:hypothetical protein